MRLNRDQLSVVRTAVFVVISLAVLSVGAVGHSQRRSPQPAPASDRDDSGVIPHGMSREVSGAMELGEGKAKHEIKLTYVWAQYSKSAGVPPGAVPGGVPVGSFHENTWTLFFSDRLLPEDSGDREMFIDVLAAEGKFNGLRIEIGDGVITWAQSYCATCKQQDGQPYWSWYDGGREVGEQVFESKILKSNMVSGTLRSSTLADSQAEGSALQYRVTFAVGLDKKPQLARVLSEAEDEPGRAYVGFYNAVEAGDAGSARRLISTESAKLLDAPDAKLRLLRLKSLIDGLNTVGFSQVYSGNGSAQLLIKTATAITPSYFARPARTRIGQPVPPPPPPPAPPSPNLDTRNRGAQRKAPSPSFALVRMVFEDNQWKVFWILDGRFNMLSEGYKTPEERTAFQRRGRSR